MRALYRVILKEELLLFKGDTIPGILAVAFGLLFLIPSIGFGVTSATSDGVPGPGFFPLIISICLIALGLVLFVKGIRDKGKFKVFVLDEDNRENLKPFFLTIAAILVFLIAIKFIMFVLAAFVLVVVMNWIYKRSWKFNLIFSSVFVGLVYVIFTVLLKVQFII